MNNLNITTKFSYPKDRVKDTFLLITAIFDEKLATTPTCDIYIPFWGRMGISDMITTEDPAIWIKNIDIPFVDDILGFDGNAALFIENVKSVTGKTLRNNWKEDFRIYVGEYQKPKIKILEDDGLINYRDVTVKTEPDIQPDYMKMSVYPDFYEETWIKHTEYNAVMLKQGSTIQRIYGKFKKGFGSDISNRVFDAVNLDWSPLSAPVLELLPIETFFTPITIFGRAKPLVKVKLYRRLRGSEVKTQVGVGYTNNIGNIVFDGIDLVIDYRGKLANYFIAIAEDVLGNISPWSNEICTNYNVGDLQLERPILPDISTSDWCWDNKCFERMNGYLSEPLYNKEKTSSNASVKKEKISGRFTVEKKDLGLYLFSGSNGEVRKYEDGIFKIKGKPFGSKPLFTYTESDNMYVCGEGGIKILSGGEWIDTADKVDRIAEHKKVIYGSKDKTVYELNSLKWIEKISFSEEIVDIISVEKLYIATSNRLYIYDEENDTFAAIGEKFSSKAIKHLLESGGVLYLITQIGGYAIVYEVSNEGLTPIGEPISGINNIPSVLGIDQEIEIVVNKNTGIEVYTKKENVWEMIGNILEGEGVQLCKYRREYYLLSKKGGDYIISKLAGRAWEEIETLNTSSAIMCTNLFDIDIYADGDYRGTTKVDYTGVWEFYTKLKQGINRITLTKANTKDIIYIPIVVALNWYTMLWNIAVEICRFKKEQQITGRDIYIDECRPYLFMYDEVVIRGASPNGYDKLANEGILWVYRIGDKIGQNDYIYEQDYTIGYDGISWRGNQKGYGYGQENNLGGKEPKPGNPYWVTYVFDSKLLYNNFGIILNMSPYFSVAYEDYRKLLKALITAYMGGATKKSINSAIEAISSKSGLLLSEYWQTDPNDLEKQHFFKGKIINPHEMYLWMQLILYLLKYIKPADSRMEVLFGGATEGGWQLDIDTQSEKIQIYRDKMGDPTIPITDPGFLDWEKETKEISTLDTILGEKTNIGQYVNII